jgi:hypothetical protein
MVIISEESVFPAAREKLWRVLELHTDNEVIGRIHPTVLSQKQVSKEGNRWVLERAMHTYGRTFNLTMRYEMAPMDFFRWEIIASTGPVTPGSYIENRFSHAGDATKLITRGEMTLKGLPGFMQRWFVGRTLGQADKEDLRYLVKSKP